MKCSIVVPTFRREALLERLLIALSHQTLAPEEFEILVCDDARSDATRTQVERWSRKLASPIRYLFAQRGRAGPAAARNLGWRAARAPLVAFTDDDIIPAKDWLAHGLAAMVPGVDAVHGRVEMPPLDGTVPAAQERDAARLADAGFLTANCFCRRAVLDRVGGFDERFRTAWREDSDLFLRLLKGGYTVGRALDAVVVHTARPPRRAEALRSERKHRLDALLHRLHPEHFRQALGRIAPKAYYASVAGVALALAGALTRRRGLAALGAAGWAAATVSVARGRLKDTSRRPSHVAEVALTSAVVPLLATFRRTRGGVEHRAAYW